jgi:phosphate:Na+ symporter
MLLLPFAKYLVMVADKVIKEKAALNTEVTTELLDARVLAIPAMAIAACNGLTEQMAVASTYAVQTAVDLLDNYTDAGASSLEEGEETLDLYEDRLGQYLTQISGRGLSDYDSRQRFKMQHVIGDFERLGDHAMNLLDSAKEKKAKGQQFSADAAVQMAVLKQAIGEILDLTCRAYQENSLELAAQVEPLEQVIDDLKEALRVRHIQRLQQGSCSIETGFVWSDLLNGLERTGDHCSNIAGCVVDRAHHDMNTHEALRSARIENQNFAAQYKAFAEKYRLA